MRLRHPFEWLTPSGQIRAFIFFFILSKVFDRRGRSNLCHYRHHCRCGVENKGNAQGNRMTNTGIVDCLTTFLAVLPIRTSVMAP